MNDYCYESFMEFLNDLTIAEEGFGSKRKAKKQAKRQDAINKLRTQHEEMQYIVPELRSIMNDINDELDKVATHLSIIVNEWEEIDDTNKRSLGKWYSDAYPFHYRMEIETFAGLEADRIEGHVSKCLDRVKRRHSDFFRKYDCWLMSRISFADAFSNAASYVVNSELGQDNYYAARNGVAQGADSTIIIEFQVGPKLGPE